MGFSGISPWSLLIILVIVLLLFGTKRLRNVGGDLGSAIKNFKKSMSETEKVEAQKKVTRNEGNVIDSDAKIKEQDKA